MSYIDHNIPNWRIGEAISIINSCKTNKIATGEKSMPEIGLIYFLAGRVSGLVKPYKMA